VAAGRPGPYRVTRRCRRGHRNVPSLAMTSSVSASGAARSPGLSEAHRAAVSETKSADAVQASCSASVRASGGYSSPQASLLAPDPLPSSAPHGPEPVPPPRPPPPLTPPLLPPPRALSGESQQRLARRRPRSPTTTRSPAAPHRALPVDELAPPAVEFGSA